jgi:hypothetical protein
MRSRPWYEITPGERAARTAWQSAKARCTPGTYAYREAFKHYGARGITMFVDWVESFDLFFAEVGPRPTPFHTLDRIDNRRGYEPGNVRWATRQEQSLNSCY